MHKPKTIRIVNHSFDMISLYMTLNYEELSIETISMFSISKFFSSQPFHFDKSWAKLVDHEKVYLFNRPIINGDYEIPETSALVLTSNLQN